MTKFETNKLYEISRQGDYSLKFRCVSITKTTVSPQYKSEKVEVAGNNTCYVKYHAMFELVDVKINNFKPALNEFFKKWYDFGQYNHLMILSSADDEQYVNISEMFNICSYKEVK